MPEGDSIHRLAAKLRPILSQQTLRRVDWDLAAAQDWRLVGRCVERVEARGKNLLIHCGPLVEAPDPRPDPRQVEAQRVVVWTHMGMRGRWRVAAASEWRGGAAALVLHTDAHVAVCTEPKIAKLLGPRGLLREPMLAQLGPDLLDPDVDLDEALARLRALGAVELGDAIMRQSAVAGIGNVYKSELLFLEGLDPFASVGALGEDRLRALLERARQLLRVNVEHGGPRRTRFDGRRRLWVYERSGRPCSRCGVLIQMRRQGALARSTYYCPRCQAVA